MSGAAAQAAGLGGQYGDADLLARIDAALAAAGRDPQRPGRDDLAGFDEFHGGGRASTRELAGAAGCGAGMRVLDVGCGIGGPARTLADEFGCRVSGIDLTPVFVAVATALSERMGFAGRTDFRVADATALPFDDAVFDRVWSQNVLMNVRDKARAFAEMARVLRAGGCVALEMNVRADGGEACYPTFWAEDPAISHLVTREEAEALLAGAGLAVVRVDDLTHHSVALAEKRRKAAAGAADPLGMQVLVTRHLQRKFANGLRNYREGRTRALQIIASKA